MDTNTILTGLGIAGGGAAIFGLWSHIRGFIETIIGYIYVTNNLGDSNVTNCAINNYCFTKLKQSFFGNKCYGVSEVFIRSLKRKQAVGYQNISKTKCFWKGWIPLWISFSNSNDEYGFTISYIRGTIDFEELLKEIIDDFNKVKVQRAIRYNIKYIYGSNLKKFKMNNKEEKPKQAFDPYDSDDKSFMFYRRVLNHQKEDIGARIVEKDFYVITSKEIETVVAEAKFWKNSEKWYEDRRIPWKYGLRLTGDPGGGKTSLTRYIAELLDIPVFVYDLASLNNEELRQEWSKMLEDAPCLVLIEDIDTVFDGRKNIVEGKEKDKLSFDCLLNCIDGIEQANGVFVVITTNCAEKLDPALIREGRVNRAVNISMPDKAALKLLCERILVEFPETWESIIKLGIKEKDNMAKFQGRCRNLAIKLYWDKLNKEKGLTKQ